jgi:RNA polymerase sigma-70 factor (ECF subfamily)
MAPSSPRTDASFAREPIAPEEERGLRPGVPGAPGADLSRRTGEELLGRYRDTRQAEVFDELVRRYAGELHRYLARYLGDPSLADDVLQNTFLQVHAKCRLYEDGRPARPWLYAIATHQAVDALRRAARRAAVSLDQRAGVGEEVEPGALVDLLVGEEPGPLEELEEAERQQWVRDGVARLPEVLRQTLILAYYQGLKYHEIAEVLGIPLGTVKSRLHLAIARLRQMARAAHLVGSA